MVGCEQDHEISFLLHLASQDPQLLFVGGLRVGVSDQAQNILDETGDSIVCALGPHSKQVLGPLPSMLVGECPPQRILAGGPRGQGSLAILELVPGRSL